MDCTRSYDHGCMTVHTRRPGSLREYGFMQGYKDIMDRVRAMEYKNDEGEGEYRML